MANQLAMLDDFLHRLNLKLGAAKLPNPQVLPGEDDSLEASWWIGRHQISVDVLPSGDIDWFWRDSVTKEYEGEEGEALHPMPERLIQHFRQAVASGENDG